MARRLDKTLIDYLVIAISPALIMTLIGSLVFFLIEVCYDGPFEARLKYIFTLYVFAAVLVARIAIEEGREHARLFAVPLAVAALVVLLRFVESAAPLTLGLILVILWCADKLTWDCTLIDETQRDTGKGLLQVAGLDMPARSQDAADAEESAEQRLEGVTSRDRAPATWWKRFVERQRRPHAPGVWVVYFSLAALPLFGIGQWWIPATDLPRRQSAFHLLVIYVASGLGLLLATSFLGLRRYLRQRRVEMPATMANLWLAIGCILIVALLMFAALLPRPNAEYAVSRLPLTIGSPDQEPSRHGVGSDGVEAEKGQLHSDQVERENGAASAKPGAEDKTKSGQGNGGGESKSKQPGGENQSQSGQEGEQDESPKEPSADPQAQPRHNPQTEQKSSDNAPAEQTQGSTEAADERARRLERQGIPRAENLIQSVGRKVGALLKWVFYIAVVLIGIYWLWHRRAEVLAALQGMLRGWGEFWHRLFGRRRQEAGQATGPGDGPKQPLPRRFADFIDPFAAGTVGRYSPDELVRYSFEALEAWAREHGCPRQPEQTPHEFARIVGTRATSLARHTRSLADLYCRLAYSPGPIGHQRAALVDGHTGPAASAGPLKQLWQQLRSETVTPSFPSVGG